MEFPPPPKRTRVHLLDELLLLGRVGHVVVDVSEQLLQGLLRVVLGPPGAGLQGHAGPLGPRRGAQHRGTVGGQQLQVILMENTSRC